MDSVKILMVDDEASILRACQRVLRREAFEVVTTTSAFEAIEMAKTQAFAVMMSDQRMPEMEGTKLLEQLRQMQPDAVRIILTGYADITAAIDAINKGSVYRFLSKPWDDEQLRTTINQAVRQYQLVFENQRLTELTRRQNDELLDFNSHLEKRVAERTREVAELNSSLEGMLLGTVNVLGRITEMHNNVIGAHSKRVATLSLQIAEEMGLVGEDLRQIHIAAMLHDVGKISLPTTLLKKATAEMQTQERELLQQHSVSGESIVKAIPGMDVASRLIRHHHERVDGGGFPDGLRGEAIPLGSRIIAVANALDKALNDRATFRNANTQNAIQSIEFRTPAWFDKSVVQSLKASLDRCEDAESLMDEEVDLKPSELRVGMTMAEELRTQNGLLLLAAGTILTEAAIERISSFTGAAIVSTVRIRRKQMAAALAEC